MLFARSVLGFASHSEVAETVISGVRVFMVNIPAVTFGCRTLASHCSSGGVSGSSILLLLRFRVIFGVFFLVVSHIVLKKNSRTVRVPE